MMEFRNFVAPEFVFADISANPRDTEVMAGADLSHQEHCDVIVAIGGGSPMDCAKGIGKGKSLE